MTCKSTSAKTMLSNPTLSSYLLNSNLVKELSNDINFYQDK